MARRAFAPATWAFWAAGAWVLPSCQPTQVPPIPAAPAPGFNDHTVEQLRSVEEFRQLAALPLGEKADRPAIAGVKFVITDFSTPNHRRTWFLDGRQYRYHDEWFWFRWLHTAGSRTVPPAVLRFQSPEQVRSWAVDHESDLPSELEIVPDDRLYSPKFYELSLTATPRPLGIGTLIHTERVGRGSQGKDIWAFELEYEDRITAPQLQNFFLALYPAVPPEARPELKWVARSPAQQMLAQALVEGNAEWQARIISYDQMSVAGETEIYSPGIVAGRLRRFPTLSGLDAAEPDSILILGAIPDYLPQARGLITAIPQTPLAHLNLLAKNRHIVNAYRGQILADPNLDQLARVSAPVVIATQGQTFRLQRLTEKQYTSWLERLEVHPKAAPAVDLTRVPYTLDLTSISTQELDQWGPILGGKSSGMVHLVQGVSAYNRGPTHPTSNFDVPLLPFAITTRAYHEHLAQLTPTLLALLGDKTFREDRRVRFLALEGKQRFARHFASRKDRKLVERLIAPKETGVLNEVIRGGGLRRKIEEQPLPPGLQETLEQALRAHFATLAPQQGLRFRSSSTAEDIEGFNGAGLYESFTGFLHPDAIPKTKKRHRVVDALRRTWSSYFAFEAFEERARNGIDHLSGNMAVLVHPRFDNSIEISNGVFTFTLSNAQPTLLVNVQRGSLSVTNPPTDRPVVPESTRVTEPAQGPLTLERLSLSSEEKPGSSVLSKTELENLFEVAKSITETRLAWENRHLPAAQRRHTLVLDFEFRQVKAGWPALQNGQNPSRFVLKQVRPLEPSPEVSEPLKQAPIPYDILARSRSIVRRRCQGGPVTAEWLQVFTDANRSPDLGYSSRPFVSEITLQLTEPSSPTRFHWNHLEFSESRSTAESLGARFMGGGPWVRIEIEGSRLRLTGETSTGHGPSPLTASVSCTSTTEFAEPDEMLRSFLDH